MVQSTWQLTIPQQDIPPYMRMRAWITSAVVEPLEAAREYSLGALIVVPSSANFIIRKMGVESGKQLYKAKEYQG